MGSKTRDGEGSKTRDGEGSKWNGEGSNSSMVNHMDRQGTGAGA